MASTERALTPLGDAQIEHWRTEGFVAVPGFFESREVRALQAGIEELKTAGKFFNVATDGDGDTHVDTKQNLQICPLSFHHPLFRAMPFHPKVRAAAGQLLGDSVYKFQDQAVLKPAGVGSATNWHQDNYYFEVRDTLKGTAMWTAVHDATVANGTIGMVPRSFAALMPHRRDLESDHDRRCFPAEDEKVPIELKAGGVVFFSLGTAHGTGPNTTAKQRAGVAWHFLNDTHVSRELALARPHPTLGFPTFARPGEEGGPYVVGDKYTAGEREYGCNMEDALAAEIDRLQA